MEQCLSVCVERDFQRFDRRTIGADLPSLRFSGEALVSGGGRDAHGFAVLGGGPFLSLFIRGVRVCNPNIGASAGVQQAAVFAVGCSGNSARSRLYHVRLFYLTV